MEFSEIDEIYKHLETNAVDYKYDHQIAGLFQRLRDLKHEPQQARIAEISQWEIDCFSFVTRSGKLISHYSGTDEKGQPWEYPSISNISDREYDYIGERLKGTTNPLLKARYSHILWESPRKHTVYAKLAVDSYLELLNIYENKDKNEPQANYGFNVLNSVEQASFLAFKVDYRVDDIRSELRRLIREFDYDSSCAFVIRVKLIEHMLKDKGNFPAYCFEGIPEVCLDFGQRLFKENLFNSAIDIYKAGEKVDKKLSQNTHDWNRSIAESYEALMNERSESDPAVVHFCQNAIEYYNIVKDEKKIQELEERYDRHRGKQHFQHFSEEIDLSEYRQKCKDIANNICSEEAEKILSILIANKSILPTLKDMEKRANEISQKTVLTNITPVSIVDRYGHVTEHFTTEDEIKYHQVLEQYGFEISLSKRILINEIFFKAVKDGKLNINSIMEYFAKRSWYGKNIKKIIPGGEISYNWLNLIAPSLNEYFIQMKANLLEPAYNPNLVLPMDSLSLKIEGLVRDICAFSGITTYFLVKDKKGRNIVREKDINWLLREVPVKSLFDEDDLLFFKYVLVEKAGFNLRHKIAHCLMDYRGYDILNMHLLILVLLRLGRYDFVKQGEKVEEKVADSD